jgi:hypothetical protein
MHERFLVELASRIAALRGNIACDLQLDFSKGRVKVKGKVVPVLN